MEFHNKLQELRRNKGITQEELANALFVSRTAVSKWESNRGYPNIDSLKNIAAFFSTTVDELLSGDELLTLAEHSSKEIKKQYRDLIFGLLDCSFLTFFFLPLFAQKTDELIKATSLLSFTSATPYFKIIYLILLGLIIILGILTLAFQNLKLTFWSSVKTNLSLALNIVCVLLFIVGLQPYAAALCFAFLIIKLLFLAKKQ